MKKRVSPLALVTAVLVCLTLSPAQAFDFSGLENSVTEYTLTNGLKVIVMERHDAPVVSCVTFVNAGGVDDPKEFTGLAHMLEHMAFKGTRVLGTTDYAAELAAMLVEDSLDHLLRSEKKKGRFADSTRIDELAQALENAMSIASGFAVPNAIDQTFEPEGAVGINAGTSKDYTRYTMSLPSNKIELWMAVESERFRHPVFREMYQERSVISEERRQVLENNPFRRCLDALQWAGFAAHPYSYSVIGHMSDIHNFSREAVTAQFEKHYVPSNMTLAIVGDVDPDHILKLAEKYWAGLPSKPTPDQVATIEPPQRGERRVRLHDTSQPMFFTGWHIPAETDPDWPALAALVDYLGEGRTSLLHTNLVKGKKLAAYVGVINGWPGSKYPCLSIAYAIPAPGHTNAECEEQVLAEVEHLKNELLPETEVQKIKDRARAAFINSLGSNMGMATSLARYQAFWFDWREMFRELDRINAVTPEDIRRVARSYYTEDNRTVVTLNTTES